MRSPSQRGAGRVLRMGDGPFTTRVSVAQCFGAVDGEDGDVIEENCSE